MRWTKQSRKPHPQPNVILKPAIPHLVNYHELEKDFKEDLELRFFCIFFHFFQPDVTMNSLGYTKRSNERDFASAVLNRYG